MRYDDLKSLLEQWKGKVCFFGAGLIGSTWAYDLFKAMEIQIDFYCDNGKRENVEIRDGIKTISLERLYSLKDNVLVFATVTYKYQNAIKKQLEENGIHNIIEMEYLFLQTFIEDLFEKNDQKLNEKFKCILDDKEYISRQFKYHMGYFPNLDKPQTFNEKIQWLKLYDRNPQYTKMVDKYEVKKYIATKIGEEFTVPTLGIYYSFDEIDFDKLPEKFVLKCTHDSGNVVICKNKQRLNKIETKNILERGLKLNYYWLGREWPYKNVRPRIIAEEYLSDNLGSDLKDYKIFNFNGEAKLIQVDYDRFLYHKRNLYTTNWEYIEAFIKYPNDSKKQINCPKELKRMISLSEQLSIHIPHVRTDLYVINDKIYIGELTFHHGSGYEIFEPTELGYKLGEMIQL